MNLLTTEQLRARGFTKPEAARYYGLRTFDTAIPQPLFDQLATADLDPWGHYVYAYDTTSLGLLFPLTVEARARMEAIGLDFVPVRKELDHA